MKLQVFCPLSQNQVVGDIRLALRGEVRASLLKSSPSSILLELNHSMFLALGLGHCVCSLLHDIFRGHQALLMSILLKNKRPDVEVCRTAMSTLSSRHIPDHYSQTLIYIHSETKVAHASHESYTLSSTSKDMLIIQGPANYPLNSTTQ